MCRASTGLAADWGEGMRGTDAYQAAIVNARRAASLYGALQAHFDRFCEQATRLNDPQYGLPSIEVMREGHALTFGI